MDSLCKTVYDPLFLFINPLQRAFPEELKESFASLIACRQNLQWSIIETISSGCSKELLVSCLNQDADSFFRVKENENPNPFLVFIGGREVYDRLVTDDERSAYWGTTNDRHLENTIRQCMVLSGIHPMKHKITNLIGKFSGQDKSSILTELAQNPEVLLDLVKTPGSMNAMTEGLKRMLEGICTTQEMNPSSLLTVVDDDVVTSGQNEDVLDAMTSPGAFLKKKNTKTTHNALLKKDVLSEMLSMFPTEDQITEEDIDDLKECMQEDTIKELMTALGSGKDPMEIMKDMMGGGSIESFMQSMQQGKSK
jgi:hypothetical protein